MSQILEQLIKQENKQQHKKMWQIMDDVVKTNKYKQGTGFYMSCMNEPKRCVLGAIVGGKDSYQRFTQRRHATFNKFNIVSDYGIPLGDSKENVIKDLKKLHKKHNVISHNHITYLNDGCNMTFPEFRDLFYEMGV